MTIDSTIFFRIYSNLPMLERKNVVVVINEQPISWEIAYIEIKNNTALGHKILQKLKGLDII